MFEPGESWTYGTGIDWAGKLVERLTKQTLEQYMKANIWDVVGAESITFWPEKNASIKERLCAITVRAAEGQSVVPYEGPSISHGVTDCMGGQGGHASMPDYLRILHSLLKDDGKLMKPETLEQFFSPQLSKDSRKALDELRTRPAEWQMMVGHFPPHIGLDWGLGGILTTEPDEVWRGKGTLLWSGVYNLTWVSAWFREETFQVANVAFQFVDRATGLCGCFGTQVLPPGDMAVEEVIVAWEKAMYEMATAKS